MESLPPAEREAARALARQIRLDDRVALAHFGSRAQDALEEASEELLAGVRDVDLSAASDVLGRMVATLRAFDGALARARRQGWLGQLLRLFRRPSLAPVLRRYPEVRREIDALSARLERHQTALLTDIATLDRLHARQREDVAALDRHVGALETKLAEVEEERLPAQAREAEQGGLRESQALRDLESARRDLARRHRDLALTRAVAAQNLAAIRLVQQNDQALVEKIDSTLLHTIPLWRQQLAVALHLERSGRAAQSLRDAAALGAELGAAHTANESLLAGLEETLSLADTDRRQRADATSQLAQHRGRS